MTALNLANIPNSINSYERLLMWCAQALQSTTNGLQVNPVAGDGPVPAASVQIAKIADNTDRAIVVVYLPIDFPALNSPTAKTWMAASDMATAAPHSNMLSN
jgi:hypothetical protein